MFVTTIIGGTDINISQETNLFVLINRGIAWVIIIVFLLSVFFIIYGGIAFILSGGKEEKIKKAVSTIRYAIIGLAVTLLATTIIYIIGKIFGYDFMGEIIDFNRISNDIRSIIQMFSSSSGGGRGSTTSLVMFLFR